MKKSAPHKKNLHASSLIIADHQNDNFINKKLPLWAETDGIQYPSRLSLEQCSGEKAARYKGRLVNRIFPEGAELMADLTGGLGVDFSFIAPHFKKAFYIERQSMLCEAARNNFPKLGLSHAEIVEADGTDYLNRLPTVNLLFIDPARRDQVGKKTVLIEDCEPDVVSLLPIIWKKTDCLLLKLSPMLDMCRAIKSLKTVSEAHIVADNGECKELLLLLRPNSETPMIFCSDGDIQFSFTTEEEFSANIGYTNQVKRYLYEPNSSILKAGAFKLVAERFHLEKLHPNSHLYTSDECLTDFPGRSFEVRQISGFSKKELKNLCQSVEKANLTIRNFPGSVAELRKRLKLKEGGDAYWFATTLSDEKHVIIDCRKISSCKQS